MSRLMFGYATLAEGEYLRALLGVAPTGFPATLNGYEVWMQEFQDMPGAVKRVISEYWGSSFKSYFARKTDNPGDVVTGIAWLITDRQEAVLDDWEFEGVWFRKQPGRTGRA